MSFYEVKSNFRLNFYFFDPYNKTETLINFHAFMSKTDFKIIRTFCTKLRQKNVFETFSLPFA